MPTPRLVFVAWVTVCFAATTAAQQQVEIPNWTTPPYWTPPAPQQQVATATNEENAALGEPELLALPTAPLPFVAVTPCRLLDTRNAAGTYGGPPLVAGTPRSFPVAGQCGVASNAGAVSVNVTVTSTQGAGFVALYPEGTTWPGNSSVNYTGVGQTVANAAVVPLGTNGFNALAGVSGTDLIVDVNGYYAPQNVVNTVNTLSGDLTLAAGSNVTITPSGSTLTIASGGAGGTLPTGSSGQTLRRDGASWVASSMLYNSGSAIGVGTTSPNEQLELTGNLRLPTTTATTGQLKLGGLRFLHAYGTHATFLGENAGSFSLTGTDDVGIGWQALMSGTSGQSNTAVGASALEDNTSGNENVALGALALMNNTTGSNNTAIGKGALESNTTMTGSTAVGRNALWNQRFNPGVDALSFQNTAVGFNALFWNDPTSADPMNAFANTAIGFRALQNNSTGSRNAALGSYALYNNTIGEGNVALGHTAMRNNTTASYNVAVGPWALYVQSYDNGGGVYATENTAVGYIALNANQPTSASNGIKNTAMGSQSMHHNTIGTDNTAMGRMSLGNNTTANYNVAIGSNALETQSFSNGGAEYDSANTAVGISALQSNQPTSSTTGVFNTAVGAGALNANTIGANDVAVGAIAGFNLTTGNYNIDIGNQGVAAEGNTIRIGTAYSAGTGQNRAFIAGIRGVTTGNADTATVLIDVNGQLGTVSSSIRFKEDVRDMGESGGRLLELRPVTFRYTGQAGERRHFGLIAEEVAEVMPDLVVRDASGQVETVAYHELPALLLDELQRQHRVIEAQRAQIDSLKAALAERDRALEKRLAALEQGQR